MNKNVMNIVKGAAVGMAAGMAVGYIGKKAADDNPKLRKKANRAVSPGRSGGRRGFREISRSGG